MIARRQPSIAVLWTMACAVFLSCTAMAESLRVGLIGLDSSHCEQFTLRLNDPASPNHVPGARVVAAFPGGSPDLPESADRVAGYTALLRDKFGVRIFDSVEEVCAEVDAVMILSVDGRPHLEQARKVVAAGKPFFLDKPVAASLADAVAVYRAAEAAGVPMFSASAVRWFPGVVEVATAEAAPALGALSYGPAPILPHHPDLFFYGIHATEALFTVMGNDCLEVRRTSGDGVSVVTGLWSGGRVGTLYALHRLPMDSIQYKLVRFGERGVVEQKSLGDYTPLLREIVRFFQTGQAPLSARETLQIYAFMEAAEESQRQGGRRVRLRDVLQRAGAPEAWLPQDEKAAARTPE
jgi:hypothetical protein